IVVRRRHHPMRAVALDVYSYSGEDTLPEQIASIRSFLRWVGRPRTFTVVSDGSYSDRSVRLLKSVDSCVAFRESEEPNPNLPEKFRAYLRSHPIGRQLALIMSLPIRDPALYVDSDVIFFPAALDLLSYANLRDAPAYYLPDCQFSGDERLLRSSVERENPVNTGVLLLFEQLDWTFSINRFLELTGEPTFFTNQTMTHLTMHKNGAHRLDPAKYVLQLDDQFVFQDRYAGSSLALRHYVNPIRHKLWTSLKY
ncbi:MAG: Nucleotide-diphospho-sugar transferase, partial [Spartobacteria bacterium]|nr:Nucleotide-diphospho-sugar transferase [Spartobacteria bacterium]